MITIHLGWNTCLTNIPTFKTWDAIIWNLKIRPRLNSFGTQLFSTIDIFLSALTAAGTMSEGRCTVSLPVCRRAECVVGGTKNSFHGRPGSWLAVSSWSCCTSSWFPRKFLMGVLRVKLRWKLRVLRIGRFGSTRRYRRLRVFAKMWRARSTLYIEVNRNKYSLWQCSLFSSLTLFARLCTVPISKY